MADYHLRGQAIFTTVTQRDLYYNKFKDYLEAMVGVVEHPDNTYPAGLAIQNNVVGETVTGPAFTVSIRCPQSEVDSPPNGTGLFSELAEEIDGLATAEFQYAFAGPF